MLKMHPVAAALFAASFAVCSLSIASELAIDLDSPTGTIKGTLTTPSGGLKPPVVLIIAGSGPTDRDGNAPTAAGKNDSLKMLSEALKDNGFASVRYDKRGVAASVKSAPGESDLRIEDYVQDAASWLSKLASDSRFSGVVVLGHSEGSLIGMLAAQNSPAAAFISMAGPGDKASTILRRQLLGRLPPELAERSEAILQSLEAGRTTSDVPTQLLSLYRPSVQPYLVSWFRYSPADEVAKLKMPCLLVQGDTDIQVAVSDVQRLHSANASCQLAVISGMNHVLKIVPADRTKQLASYGDPTLSIAPELRQVITRFLTSAPVKAAFGPH